ncbi:MAG: hypothetical protein KGQ93_10060 [Cyanobacteria bacterium REEB459]|nr:hypothetical protein [Cyanobacteria bacterium REEB459]
MVKRPPSLDSHDPPLSAPLQAGLESLAVNLDEELQRYRQGVAHRRSGSRLKLRPKTQTPPRLPQLPHPPLTPAPEATGPGGAGAPPQVSPPVPEAETSRQLTPYAGAAEDYLESTEALLETDPTAYITDYTFSSSPSSAAGDRPLANPLGLGALLLLLLTSAGLGYLVTSPQTITQLKHHPLLQRLAQVLPQATSTQPAPAADPSRPVASSPGPGLEGLGPDLSAQEFGQLDLNRLSNLPSSLAIPASSPSQSVPDSEVTATPEPKSTSLPPLAAPQGRSDRPPTLSSPADVTTPTPPPSPRKLSRSSTPAISSSSHRQPPKPLGSPVPVQPPLPPAPLSQAPRPLSAADVPTPRYYVVANYTGDASLQAARQRVADAYLRNFARDTKIQLGAFAQRSAAQDLIKRLQSQGLTVQLYVLP